MALNYALTLLSPTTKEVLPWNASQPVLFTSINQPISASSITPSPTYLGYPPNFPKKTWLKLPNAYRIQLLSLILFPLFNGSLDACEVGIFERYR